MDIILNAALTGQSKFKKNRRKLFARTAISGLMISCLTVPAYADDMSDSAGGEELTAASITANAATKMVEETNRYYLSLTTQIFDGHSDFSHTQNAGFTRMRKGNESWALLNFGDGAVVIDGQEKTAVSAFTNISETEQSFHYDYNTNTVKGDPAVAAFHNQFVRPLLNQGPALGKDDKWNVALNASNLGLKDIKSDTFNVALSRDYFTHENKDYVLIHYAVPSFGYHSQNGSIVVHWAKGTALTDTGFGTVYWNGSLHRAVAQQINGDSRPYRYVRSAVAIDKSGKALVDPRKMPAVASYLKQYEGSEARGAIVFADDSRRADQIPIALAAKLDIMALSLLENSANQTGDLAAAMAFGDRGMEHQSVTERANDQGGIVAGIADRISGPSDGAIAGAIGQNSGSATAGTQNLGNSLNRLTGKIGENGSAGEQGSSSNAGGGIVAGTADRIAGSSDGAIAGAISDRGSDTINTFSQLQEQQQKSDEIDQMQSQTRNDAMKKEAQREIIRNDAVNKINERADSGETADAAKAGFSIPANIVDRLRTSNSDAVDPFANVRDGKADKTALFGNQGGEAPQTTAEQVSDGLSSAAGNTDKINTYANAAVRIANDITREGKILRKNATETTNNLVDAVGRHKRAVAAFETAANAKTSVPADILRELSNDIAAAERNLAAATGESNRATKALVRYGAKGQRLAGILNELPTEAIQDVLDQLGNSPAGKVLEGVNNGLNASSVIGSGYNVYKAGTSDLSSGPIPISGSYVKLDGNLNFDDVSPVLGLGATLLSLAGNALTGNAKGFYSDATALTVGAVTDVAISVKSVYDVNRLNTKIAREGTRLEKERTEKIIARSERLDGTIQRLDSEEEELDGSIANYDELEEKKPEVIADIKRQRREAKDDRKARERELERKRAKAERDRERKRKRKEYLAGANDRLQDEFKPKYPTAKPRDKERAEERVARNEETVPPPTILTDEQLARIKGQNNDFDLAGYQNDKLNQRRLDQQRRDQERLDRIRNSSLSNIDPVDFDPVTFDPVMWDPVKFEPVVFEPVKWEPVKWTPPEWVPPQFDAPDPSEIAWTNFADDDWDFGGNVPSFTYGNMSGKVNTDLSQWQEWLAKQDIARLQRLARQAGYPEPNPLAAALADASSLLREANDTGWRKWALAAPSCTGINGCGSQYSERWAAKRSRLALGDILNMDREFFSTAGLTDIEIAGLFFVFSIIDFGIDDGDRVNIRVSQFGQALFNRSLTINTSGTQFRVPVRRGVVSVLLTALNTGEFPPNTAALSIDSVTGGQSSQNYSLGNGETAGLRVNVGGEAR